MIRYLKPGKDTQTKSDAGAGAGAAVRATVESILKDVETRGDAAVPPALTIL